MKSALELAMERADAERDEEYVALTPEQVEEIEEIRRQYEARWAEQEIVLKGRMEKLARETDPQTFAEHQSQLQAEMSRVREQIFAERDEKIEQVRRQARKEKD